MTYASAASRTIPQPVPSTPELPSAEGQPHRLLIPVNADADSRRGVTHAIERHLSGEPIEIVLLHVMEPITQWEILRSMTRAEVDDFQSQSARQFIDEAADALLAIGISCRSVVRHGNTASIILDTARAEDCAEILLPAPVSGWEKFVSRDVVSTVVNRVSGGTKVVLLPGQKHPHTFS